MYKNDPLGLPWTEGNTWQSVDVQEAWFPIIEKLNRDLLNLDPDYRVFQVKEKFGDLRYYYETGTTPTVRFMMESRVREAELEAYGAKV